eukprot:Selendium_serpulae@DN6181_c1_g7_i2.p1
MSSDNRMRRVPFRMRIYFLIFSFCVVLVVLNHSHLRSPKRTRGARLNKKMYNYNPPPPNLVTVPPEIPFYMYWNNDYQEIWDECSTKVRLGYKKHQSVWQVVRQLSHHPWRTEDTSKAIIFVVPVSFFGVAPEGCNAFDERFPIIMGQLAETEQFKRNNGRDHLFVDIHPEINTWVKSDLSNSTKQALKIAQSFIQTRLSSDRHYSRPSHCSVVAPFTTFFEEPRPPQTDAEWNARQFDYFFIGQADGHLQYESRHRYIASTKQLYELRQRAKGLRVAQSATEDYHFPQKDTNLSLVAMTTSNNTQAVVEGLDHCGDNMTMGCWTEDDPKQFMGLEHRSRYHLMIRGGNIASRQLYDSIHAGGINLLIDDMLVSRALPFECLVPWRDMIFQIPQAVFDEDPIGSLEKFNAKFGVNGTH